MIIILNFIITMRFFLIIIVMEFFIIIKRYLAFIVIIKILNIPFINFHHLFYLDV